MIGHLGDHGAEFPTFSSGHSVNELELYMHVTAETLPQFFTDGIRVFLFISVFFDEAHDNRTLSALHVLSLADWKAL